MEQWLGRFVEKYAGDLYFPDVQITDIVEVMILTFLIYQVMVWIKNTKAWMLMKGIIVLAVFILLAAIFKMHTILYIAKNAATVMATAAIVVFQPELRRALEKLGEKKFLTSVVPFESNREKSRFSEETRESIIEAAYAMGKVKTGALIVIERETPLSEIERTGIEVDGIVTSQLLINIFEHNTPLHDGAVIIRGNRVTAATCYLPLSDNLSISKDLGTRHRAALGISETSDSLTVVVSEETGRVSLARDGQLTRISDQETLRQAISVEKGEDTGAGRFRLWKGRHKNERKAE